MAENRKKKNKTTRRQQSPHKQWTNPNNKNQQKKPDMKGFFYLCLQLPAVSRKIILKRCCILFFKPFKKCLVANEDINVHAWLKSVHWKFPLLVLPASRLELGEDLKCCVGFDFLDSSVPCLMIMADYFFSPVA